MLRFIIVLPFKAFVLKSLQGHVRQLWVHNAPAAKGVNEAHATVPLEVLCTTGGFANWSALRMGPGTKLFLQKVLVPRCALAIGRVVGHPNRLAPKKLSNLISTNSWDWKCGTKIEVVQPITSGKKFLLNVQNSGLLIWVWFIQTFPVLNGPTCICRRASPLKNVAASAEASSRQVAKAWAMIERSCGTPTKKKKVCDFPDAFFLKLVFLVFFDHQPLSVFLNQLVAKQCLAGQDSTPVVWCSCDVSSSPGRWYSAKPMILLAKHYHASDLDV